MRSCVLKKGSGCIQNGPDKSAVDLAKFKLLGAHNIVNGGPGEI